MRVDAKTGTESARLEMVDIGTVIAIKDGVVAQNMADEDIVKILYRLECPLVHRAQSQMATKDVQRGSA